MKLTAISLDKPIAGKLPRIGFKCTYGSIHIFEFNTPTGTELWEQFLFTCMYGAEHSNCRCIRWTDGNCQMMISYAGDYVTFETISKGGCARMNFPTVDCI